MNIWEMEKWRRILPSDVRSGLRLRFDKGVYDDVKNACIKYAKWLREYYDFPIRIPIYFKNTDKLKTVDEKGAYATFFRPNSFFVEPYIRVAVGDYEKRKSEWGKDNILFAYLVNISHELTHYYQWINDLKLTTIGEERQATTYANKIIQEYVDEVLHP